MFVILGSGMDKYPLIETTTRKTGNVSLKQGTLMHFSLCKVGVQEFGWELGKVWGHS